VAQPIKKAPWRARRHRLAGTRSGADRAHPAREGAWARFAGHPWRRLPRGSGLRLLEIGCGTAEDAGLWLHKGVHEYVGVDLDEQALVYARSRWPHLTFLCEDAASLSPEVVRRFHLVLIRQPDLWARPANWHQVFAALPPLLLPAGRVLVEVAGKGEAALAQRWLREAGLLLVGRSRRAPPRGFLLVAEAARTRQPQQGGGPDGKG